MQHIISYTHNSDTLIPWYVCLYLFSFLAVWIMSLLHYTKNKQQLIKLNNIQLRISFGKSRFLASDFIQILVPNTGVVFIISDQILLSDKLAK